MNRFYLPLLFAYLLISCTSNTSETAQFAPEKYPHDFMFMQRAYPTGEIKTTAYSEAIQWKRNLANRNANGLLWEFSGPHNIGGRITDIEIPSSQGQTYYIGAASGGIFKTTDAGANWLPIFDEQEVLSIGDIEISKTNNNLIWVGTGEVNAGGGSLAYDGDGIYKSEDAGLTWQVKGLPDVGSIGKILIDPTDDDIVFVGAMGPLFRNDTNRGVYKSTDGGDTWEQKLFVSDSTGVIDMAIHPVNGSIVYAASWERIRRPNRRDYGGETSRIYRSTDGGENWQELTNGLPSVPADKGRISIDISQSNPNVLYARYASATGGIQGVYRTADGGDTWVAVNSNQLSDVGFHWWFQGVVIDPTDEDVIYNVDFVVEKSTDGGNNWFTAFPNVHVDQHALAFNTMVPGSVLLGNDGGLYYSSDDGVSSVKDVTLPITQFYRFHVDAQNENKLYGGAQDNSTMRTTTGGLDDWNIITGGDGFQPLVDPTNTNVIYALSQYGNLIKSTNDAMSFSGATTGIAGGDRKNWDTPIAFDPSNSQIMYYGANRLYKSTNAAGSWTAISPDLSNGPHTGNLVYGTIISISVSPIHTDTIYVGTDDGNVWITEDGGANWNLISASLPNRWVTKVLASRDDIHTVYVTFSGYRYGADEGHIYRSTNNGNSWFDISTNLPDIPINDIEQDANGNLYLGTDIGVLASGNQGFSWEVLGDNLPSVVVTDLYIHEATEVLYAGTYGRSSYKLDISVIVLGDQANAFDDEVTLYPNPARDYVQIKMPKSNKETKIAMYDQLGRVKLTRQFQTNESIHLALNNFAKGVYFVKIIQGNKHTTKKLLIK